MRINAVAPSIAIHAFPKKSVPEELLDELAAKEAFGRGAEPWEVTSVLPERVCYDKLKMAVDVGCDRVGFPAPVRLDAHIRGRGEVFSAEPARLGCAGKPGCVVEAISRLLFSAEDAS